MAWRSSRRWLRLCGVASACAACLRSGCYFSPSPLPEDPASERPNVSMNGAVPPVFQIINVRLGDAPLSFTVPFTSVDAGERVWWFLWGNWNLEGQEFQKGMKGSLPPGEDLGLGMGGASSLERSIQFFWTPYNLPPGCNQLTLFVTHANNANHEVDLPIDISQSAIVTYWVNIDAPLDQSQTLVDCPVPMAGQ